MERFRLLVLLSCSFFFSLLGLRKLGKERAPKQDGAPKEKEHDAERLRERQRELGQREGVGCDEGEESEG